MSSGVKSTIFTATSEGTSIAININAVAAVSLTALSGNNMCGLWHDTDGVLRLSIFRRASSGVALEYIHTGYKFRVLYVD